MSDRGENATAAPRLRVTMVRCATTLLSYGDTHLLTDPWFAMHMRGLPVFRRPGCSPDAFPPLAAVLVSHLHPDHFDPDAIARLHPPPRVVILPPGGVRAVQRQRRRERILTPWASSTLDQDARAVELTPWSTHDVAGLRVTAVPALHTGPPPAEVNYVVEIPSWGTLFFGGDTRLERSVFATLRERFGPFRLALLPVGGTRIFGVRTVMDPEEAEEATRLLDAEHVIPLHEGGLWMSVPPLSRHPGRAAELKARFLRRGEPERVVVLGEGAAAEFTAS